MLVHYQALSAGDLGEVARPTVVASDNWLNCMFATKPLVSMQDGAIMYDYYFQEENFVIEDAARRNHFLALVAYNINGDEPAQTGTGHATTAHHSQHRSGRHPPTSHVGDVPPTTVILHAGVSGADHQVPVHTSGAIQ